jgi:predicted helicase
MSKAKIFYFTLQDEQTKEEKRAWFERAQFEQIPFDHITPDQKANWINLTDNDFDSFLPLIDKEVKAGRSQEAVFRLFSAGVKTQRDEWVYDFSKDALIERMKYFVEVYQEQLEKGVRRELDIKWDADLENYGSSGLIMLFQIKAPRTANSSA